MNTLSSNFRLGALEQGGKRKKREGGRERGKEKRKERRGRQYRQSDERKDKKNKTNTQCR